MALKKVYFCNRREAEAKRPKVSDRAAVISIYCSDQEPANLQGEWAAFHRPQFDDIETELSWPIIGTDTVRRGVLFDMTHARDIIKFITDIDKLGVELIIVHCHAGISRSAAVAKFIAECFGLDFNHGYKLYNKHVYSTLKNLKELIDAQSGDPDGQYCCPVCLTWYLTPAEKDRCLTDTHGYETLNITMNN